MSRLGRIKQTTARLSKPSERTQRKEESMRQIDSNARGEAAAEQSASDDAARRSGNPPDVGGQG